MNEKPTTDRAIRVYSLLLKLYPKDDQRAFGSLMLQTFQDQYRDLSAHGGRPGFGFWLAVASDVVRSILREHTMALRTKRVLPILILVGVILLVGSIIVQPIGGISRLLSVIVTPVVLIFVTYFVLKSSPQTDSAPPEPAEGVWIRQGLRYGIIFGVVWLVFNAMNNLATFNSPLFNLTRSFAVSIMVVIMPFVLGLAGFISGRSGRNATHGTLVALLAVIVSSVIMVVSLVATMMLFWEVVRYNAFQDPGMVGDWQRSGTVTFDQFLWGDNLGGAFFATLFTLILSGLVGTLGGALGASSHDRENGTGLRAAE